MQKMCFACGEDNPISLGLKFKKIGPKRVKAEFVPEIVHQGYAGIMHGGLVTTLLDEAMVTAIILEGIEAVTATLNIRFKKPVPIGEKITVIGYITGSKSRLITTAGCIHNSSGETMAVAEAKFMRSL